MVIRDIKHLALIFIFALALQGCSSDEPNKTTQPSEELTQQEPMESTPQQSAKPMENMGAKISENGNFRSFTIYTDGNSPDNHYVPSGWMGDYGDLKIDEKHMKNPHGGSTCVQIVYNGKATQGARWAGMYWQNPPNNWGTRPGGYDLTGAKKLTFWARGEQGGERIEEFKIGGITGEYADSDIAGIGPVVLSTEWQQFTIDLEGKDLSSISGGFCWATNLDANPEGCTFYLDDIKYE
jgi:hypothetical protein